MKKANLQIVMGAATLLVLIATCVLIVAYGEAKADMDARIQAAQEESLAALAKYAKEGARHTGQQLILTRRAQERTQRCLDKLKARPNQKAPKETCGPYEWTCEEAVYHAAIGEKVSFELQYPDDNWSGLLELWLADYYDKKRAIRERKAQVAETAEILRIHNWSD